MEHSKTTKKVEEEPPKIPARDFHKREHPHTNLPGVVIATTAANRLGQRRASEPQMVR